MAATGLVPPGHNMVSKTFKNLERDHVNTGRSFFSLRQPVPKIDVFLMFPAAVERGDQSCRSQSSDHDLPASPEYWPSGSVAVVLAAVSRLFNSSSILSALLLAVFGNCQPAVVSNFIAQPGSDYRWVAQILAGFISLPSTRCERMFTPDFRTQLTT